MGDVCRYGLLSGYSDKIDPRGSYVSGEVSATAAEFVSTGGELAALVAAGAFLVLCLVISWLIAVRVGSTVKATTKSIEDINARAGVMLNNVNTTVEHVNTALVKSHLTLDEVNAQLVRVDTMTGHAQQVTGNVANLTTLVSAAATNPLVKLAAFGFGVRRATAKRRHEESEREMREAMSPKKSRRKRRGSSEG